MNKGSQIHRRYNVYMHYVFVCLFLPLKKEQKKKKYILFNSLLTLKSQTYF